MYKRQVIVSAIVNSLDLQLSEPTDVDKIDSTQYKVGAVSYTHLDVYKRQTQNTQQYLKSFTVRAVQKR